MSAKRVLAELEVIDIGARRLYVKPSTGFVIHSDDLSPEELLQIAHDITARQALPPGEACLDPTRLTVPANTDSLPQFSL
jgi:hypothetical protein